MNTNVLRSLSGLLLALALPWQGLSQASLRGVVTSERGLPLSRARVYVAGTFASSLTDSLGRFALSYSGALPLKLVASLSEHQADTLLVEHLPSSNLSLVLRGDRRLPELIVSASAIGIGSSKANPILKPMDIYTNSAAAGDLALSLRQLPGVQEVSDREGFFVHGGDASEVAVSIEGVVIRNFFGNDSPYAKARSRFPTGLFGGVSLATGGYSASEVGGLSGALRLSLEGKTPRSLSLGLMPFGLSVGMASPSRSGRLFAEHWVSVEEASYLRLFLRPEYQMLRPSYGGSYVGRLVYTPSSRDHIKAMAMLSYDRTRLSLSDPNPRYGRMLYAGQDYYAFVMGRWQRELSDGANLSLSLGAEYNRHHLERSYLLTDAGGLGLRSEARDLQLRLGYRTQLASVRLSLGADYSHRHRSLIGLPYPLPPLSGHSLEAYAEVALPISRGLSLTSGVRALYQSLASGVALLPRLSLSMQPQAQHLISLEVGKYADLDEYYQSHGHLPSERQVAYQASLTYQWRPARHQLLRLVVYDKEYRRLLRLVHPELYQWSYDGRGYARGLDLLWRQTGLIPNLEHWLSYSYTDAQRMSLLSPGLETPSYVARHTLSLITKWWCPPLGSLINATIAYRSGLTYHNPNLEGAGYFNAWVPARWSLDLSYNYPFRQGKLSGVLFVGALGLLSTDLPLGYRFSDERLGDHYPSLAITSPTKPMLMVGLFLNIGVDRRKDHLNTNLNIR